MKIKKPLLLMLGIIISAGFIFYACKKKATLVNEVATLSPVFDGSGEVYQVDTAASIIEWIGSTPGNSQHNGIIKLSNGQFTVNNNQLTSGKFTIDVNSIANLDQSGKDRANLESHLKDKDFFEVEKYPIGSFEITEIKIDSSGQRAIGNLTLKQVTNSIQIPVTIKIDEKSVVAETPTFSIDRTKWGIVYNSGIIGTIKDDLIRDEITLKLKIVAAKGQSKNL